MIMAFQIDCKNFRIDLHEALNALSRQNLENRRANSKAKQMYINFVTVWPRVHLLCFS